MRPSHLGTPRQLIKCVHGLRDARSALTLILDDSTLMDMDAPELMPAGSTVRLEPLRDHRDHHDYFVVRETVVFRDPLADGSYA